MFAGGETETLSTAAQTSWLFLWCILSIELYSVPSHNFCQREEQRLKSALAKCSVSFPCTARVAVIYPH